MKFRKLLSGLLCLAILILTSNIILAEEVVTPEAEQTTEFSLSSNRENSNLQGNKTPTLKIEIIRPREFSCAVGKKSEQFFVRIFYNDQQIKELSKVNISWWTTDTNLIKINNPHSFETTVTGLNRGGARVIVQVSMRGLTQMQYTEFRISEATSSGTEPNKPSSYNSNNDETSEVYRLYSASNNEPSILYSRGNNKF